MHISHEYISKLVYSVRAFVELLNKHQISGGGAYLGCYHIG